jgi:hypothetical protein
MAMGNDVIQIGAEVIALSQQPQRRLSLVDTKQITGTRNGNEVEQEHLNRFDQGQAHIYFNKPRIKYAAHITSIDMGNRGLEMAWSWLLTAPIEAGKWQPVLHKDLRFHIPSVVKCVMNEYRGGYAVISDCRGAFYILLLPQGHPDCLKVDPMTSMLLA